MKGITTVEGRWGWSWVSVLDNNDREKHHNVSRGRATAFLNLPIDDPRPTHVLWLLIKLND